MKGDRTHAHDSKAGATADGANEAGATEARATEVSATGARDWPEPADWIWNGPLAAPCTWGKPGIVMAFNLECAGCVSRGIPLLKRLAAEHGDALQLALLHTAYGHRSFARAEVEKGVRRFAESFARLPFPVALDVSGELAQAWGAEGTPHWWIYGSDGERLRSFYGSQDNARTRLEYLAAELVAPAA